MRKTSNRVFLSQFIRNAVHREVHSYEEMDKFDNLFFPIIESALNDCDSNILLSLDSNGEVCEKESIV